MTNHFIIIYNRNMLFLIINIHNKQFL